MELRLIPAQVSESPQLSKLVHASFITLAASAWEDSSVVEFLKDTEPEPIGSAIASSFLAVAAWREGVAVGFALMPRASLLGMMFVRPRGCVATRMACWLAARTMPANAV